MNSLTALSAQNGRKLLLAKHRSHGIHKGARLVVFKSVFITNFDTPVRSRCPVRFVRLSVGQFGRSEGSSIAGMVPLICTRCSNIAPARQGDVWSYREAKKRNLPGWECVHRRHPHWNEDSLTQNRSFRPKKSKSKQVIDFYVFYWFLQF